MILAGAGAGDGGGPERGRNHRLPGVPPDDEEEKLRGRPDAGHSLLFTEFHSRDKDHKREKC